jgi:Fe-S-cluster containining protein
MDINAYKKIMNDYNNEEYWDKITGKYVQPPKIKKDFTKEFLEWYQEVISSSYSIINQWEKSVGISHTCCQGCSHCCYHLIEIYGFELLAIMSYIEDKNLNYILNKAVDIAELIEKKFSGYEKDTSDYRMQYRSLSIPCIFLKNNTCLIYPVRPTSCVTYFSYGSHDGCARKGVIPKHCKSFGTMEDWIVKQISVFFEYNDNKVPHYFNPFDLKALPIAILDYMVVFNMD